MTIVCVFGNKHGVNEIGEFSLVNLSDLDGVCGSDYQVANITSQCRTSAGGRWTQKIFCIIGSHKKRDTNTIKNDTRYSHNKHIKTPPPTGSGAII